MFPRPCDGKLTGWNKPVADTRHRPPAVLCRSRVVQTCPILVVPEKNRFPIQVIGDLGQGRYGGQRSLESHRRPTVLSFFLNPAQNEPKENSEEFSQVKAAAHQQGVDAIAVFALQVV